MKTSRPRAAVKGNIKDETYDPFPKFGLVKQYEPYIRQTVTEFCRKYPKVSRQDLLIEAVRLATVAEAKFKPEQGYDFSTFLRWHLKGLHRFAERELKYSEHLVRLDATAAEEINARAATGRASAGPDDDPNDDNTSNPVADAFSAEARAAGLRSAGPCRWLGQGIDPRHLLQLYGTPKDRLTAGMSADMLTILDGPASVLAGRMQAVIAHNERRKREAEQEAENQKNGNYDPVFYEPRPFSPLGPICKPPMSTLIPARASIEKEFAELKRTEQRRLLNSVAQSAANALQPSLSVIKGAVLDWMIRPAGRTMTQMAADVGISKGYASKLVDELQPRLREQMLRLILRNVPRN